LLLGLKGTMSEYELSLLRQRGLAARDTKAKRGELRFTLPPGFCWSEAGRIEMAPDERITGVIRLVPAKFRELGSARQVFLWARQAELAMPVVERNSVACRIVWKPPAYHTVLQGLQNPIYAGAYAFGRRGQRTTVKEGRARKTDGHSRPMSEWLVLLKDNHAGYISWAEFEENQRMIVENAHMQKRAARKSARGGRALLTGLTRCGRCGRMMRVFYGSRSGHAHRYQRRGDDGRVGSGLCIGIGGKRVDQAVAIKVLEDALPSRGIRSVEYGLQLLPQQIRNQARIRFLERDRQDPADLLQGCRLPVFEKAEERLDGRQPDVARHGCVVALVLEMLQEGADQAGVELLQCQC
jgi:hypothetical protein